MEVKEMLTNELKEYGNNPRLISDEAVDKVAESIKEFGFKVPIIIDKDNVIVAGHTRRKAALSLGVEKVPVIVADDLTEEQIKAFPLADNKVAEFSDWDAEALMDEIDNIDMDIEVFGFDDLIDEGQEVEEHEVEEDEFDVEPPVDPKSKPGDIYQLGRHRLMCGDSTRKEDVVKLMGGQKADMVFTDPPYGMKKEKDGVTNDNLNDKDLLEFNKLWIPLTLDALKKNGSWYCWGIDFPLMDMYQHILKPLHESGDISVRNYITWYKGSARGQRSDLMRMFPIATEKCWFVMKGAQEMNVNSDNYDPVYDPIRLYLNEEAEKVGLNSRKLREITNTQMWSHWFTKSQFSIIPDFQYKKLQDYYEGEAFNMPHSELKALFKTEDSKWTEFKKQRSYFDNTHDNMNDLWEFHPTSGKERAETGGHATPKPLKLCARAIKSSSKENEIVLDVFGGSGSTLIASEQLNRSCYAVELEPKWVDVIINRWEEYTGEKAVKING